MTVCRVKKVIDVLVAILSRNRVQAALMPIQVDYLTVLVVPRVTYVLLMQEALLIR
jgi:hypothetical protein